MDKRIMQLQVLNPHARVFAIAAGRRNQMAAELARAQHERHRSPLATLSKEPLSNFTPSGSTGASRAGGSVMRLVRKRIGAPAWSVRLSMLLLSCVVVAAGAMALAPASNGASDVTPPTLVPMSNGLPATMNAGDSAVVTARITDDLSGVAKSRHASADQPGEWPAVRLHVDERRPARRRLCGHCDATEPGGHGHLAGSADLQDNALNQTQPSFPGTIVVGGTSDTTPPSLDSFSLDKTTTSDLANGPDTVTATLQISDAGSGVSLCQVTLFAPSGNQVVFKQVFCHAPTATAVFQLPRYSRPGTWTPYVTLYDNAGNHSSSGPSGADLVVVDSNPDTTPPTLSNPSVSPAAVDAGETPQFVSVTADPPATICPGSAPSRSATTRPLASRASRAPGSASRPTSRSRRSPRREAGRDSWMSPTTSATWPGSTCRPST